MWWAPSPLPWRPWATTFESSCRATASCGRSCRWALSRFGAATPWATTLPCSRVATRPTACRSIWWAIRSLIPSGSMAVRTRTGASRFLPVPPPSFAGTTGSPRCSIATIGTPGCCPCGCTRTRTSAPCSRSTTSNTRAPGAGSSIASPGVPGTCRGTTPWRPPCSMRTGSTRCHPPTPRRS